MMEHETAARSRAASAWRPLAGLFLIFLSVYLISAPGHFQSTDHVAVYLVTQSLVENGSLAIKPILNTTQAADGRWYSPYGIGQSLLSIPLYLLGRFVDDWSSPALKHYWGGPPLRDWGGTVRIYFVSLLNQFLTPLLCVLVFLFCRELGASRRAALAVTFLFGFGTNVWVQAREYFQHPLESLTLLLAVYLLFRQRERLTARAAVLAGAAFAFGLLTRVNLLVLAPALVLYVWVLGGQNAAGPAAERGWRFARTLWLSWRGKPLALALPTVTVTVRQVHGLVAFLLPVVAVGLILLGINYVKYGNPLTTHGVAVSSGGLTTTFANPLWVGVYGYLFSVGRSVFLYSPPALLGLLAYRTFFRRHRAEAILFAALCLTYLLFYSSFHAWEGGWAWGPRYLMPVLPFLVIPSSYFLQGAGRWLAALAVGLLGVLIQVLGVVVSWSPIYFIWMSMRLVPEDAYLFVPSISPIAMHLQALRSGQFFDLWLLWVRQEFGTLTFLCTLAVPVILLLQGLSLLGNPRGVATPRLETELPTRSA